MTKSLGKQQGMNVVLLSFLVAAAGAIAIFLPFLVVDKGFFIYAGDYNEQQIPFYMYVQQFIKAGGGTWSWATDIGSSVVNSYSFYNLGSPFLWLTVPFPTSWMPYLMVPLFVLKFACIGGAAALYLSRYSKNRNLVVICSVVYAFAGFNIYNIFFNHMLDAVVLFPLMLWALDGYVYEQKRGFFAVFVGLALLNNYFFFAGNVTFVILYFVVKVATGEYRISLANFGLLALEAVLGVGMGMVLALPTLYSLIGNPRTTDFSNGLGLLLYGNVHQYFNILTSMLVPPDPPYLPNLFPDGNIKWTSMSLFLPIVSIAGVAAYCKSRKKTATKWLIGISLLMALVPILNSSFYAFNSSYYARWYYMPLLVMCFATLRSLEDMDIDLAWGSRFALVATGLYGIFGLLPTKKNEEWLIGAAGTRSKFWLTYLTAMLAVCVFYILVRFYRKKVRFAPLLLAAVLGFSVFYSVTHMSLTKFPQWENDKNYREQNYVDARALTFPSEDEFFRVDTYETTDNLGLWMNQSSIRTFNSTVSPSIMAFNPLVGVKRDVSSKPDRKLYALRGLLSVKYTVMPLEKQDAFVAAAGEEEYRGNEGWNYLKEQGSLAVYESENFVPLGFTYDSFIRMDTLRAVAELDRSGLLMRGIGLTEEQYELYGYLFNEEIGDGYLQVSYENYVLDCNDRRATASYEVAHSASGFASRIRLARDNLVFYGVPYDPGFTATVNGVETQVLNVSGGMMAVFAPAGENDIVFQYETPGLSLGGSFTVLSLSFLVLYLTAAMLVNQRKARRKSATAANKPLAEQKKPALADAAPPQPPAKTEVTAEAEQAPPGQTHNSEEV